MSQMLDRQVDEDDCVCMQEKKGWCIRCLSERSSEFDKKLARLPRPSASLLQELISNDNPNGKILGEQLHLV